LEGLEISEVLLSDIFSSNHARFDAEFFSKLFIESLLKIDRKQTSTISQIATVTDGEHGSPELDEKSNILYLSGHNIKENYIDISNVRFCSKELHKKNARSSVKEGTVLMSIVGTVGKASAINQAITANTDRNVATIKNIAPSLLPNYLSTLLNCFYGKLQTKRFATGNVQPLLNLTQVKAIVVPLLNMKFQKVIERLILESFSCSEQSTTLYQQAESLLLDELGLRDFTPDNESVNIKSFSESFGITSRLDAEFYQKKYEVIEEKIKSYRLGYTQIKDQFKQNKDTFKKDDKAFYNYVEIGSVNTSTAEIEAKSIIGKELPDNAKRKVYKGDVLISKVRTYRGGMTIVDRDDYVASGAFTVLAQNGSINKETLLVFLKSKFMRDYTLKPNTGTSYPVIVDDDVLSFYIPLINLLTQQQIASLINDSFAMREKSKTLLELAKKAVEKAVEEDEQTATSWLDEQLAL
jgi:type I restriction enzyme S subunit